MSCSERQVQEAKLNINTANGKAQHIQWKVQVEKQHNGTGVGWGGGVPSWVLHRAKSKRDPEL